MSDFQFGGPTHCLIFGPDVNSEFVAEAIPQDEQGQASPVVNANSFLANMASSVEPLRHSSRLPNQCLDEAFQEGEGT